MLQRALALLLWLGCWIFAAGGSFALVEAVKALSGVPPGRVRTKIASCRQIVLQPRRCPFLASGPKAPGQAETTFNKKVNLKSFVCQAFGMNATCFGSVFL